MRKPLMAAGAAAALTFATLGLSACANPVEAVLQQGAESAIKEIAEQNDVDINLGSGASVPADWPSEVPVPKGSVEFSAKAQGGFSLTLLAEKSDVEAAVAQFTANGFEETANFESADGAMYTFENAEWTVALIIGEDGSSGKTSIIYTVAPKS